MRYTKTQNKAIHHEGENILVSASAGSGKTGVLKARVLRKIEDGIDIDKLIVLTFTEAAAAEMKSRIIQAMTERKLDDQLIKMDNAIISTFDAFTLRLVKTYHYLLNLPEDIKISDALVIEMASKEVLEHVIQSAYKEADPEFVKMVKLMFSGNDRFLEQGILKLAHAIKKIPNHQAILDDYDQVFNHEMVQDAYQTYLTFIKADIHQIFLRFNQYYQDNIHQFSEDCDAYLDECMNLYQALDQTDDLETLKQNIIAFSLPTRPRKPRDKDVWLETDTNIKEVRKISDELTQTHLLDTDYLDTWKETLPRVKVLLTLTKAYLSKLKHLQRERNLYSFDDMMNFAIELFENHEEIRRYYQTHINEVLIDEYQDTNDLQDYFISLIANNNIFMVGDVKQSIYRFRDANPKNFLGLLLKYQSSNQGQAIRLLENFRSNRLLLDQMNTLFTSLMNEDRGGVDYEDDHALKTGYSLTYGLHHQSHTLNHHFYDVDQIKENFEDVTKEEIEATIVANDILRKFNGRQAIFEQDELRPIKYSDITILVDRKTSFDTYKKVLSSFSIPVDVFDRMRFSDADEIIFINQFLILLNAIYTDDLTHFKQSLYAVARSFVYQIPDQTIIHFLIQADANIDQFMAYEPFNQLAKDMKALLQDVNGVPNVDLIEKIYEITHIYAKLVHLDSPGSSAKKLDHFRHLVAEQKETTFNDLIDYIRFIQEERDIDIEYKETKDDLEAVKLMSIHASKGLQFPVVYLMGLYKRFNFTENKDPFNFSKDYGVLTYGHHDGFYRTFLERLYFRQELKEDVSEKIRLLYVAMTRAKEEINLLLEAKDNHQSDPLRYTNYQDMLYDGYQLEPYDIINHLKMPETTKTKHVGETKETITHHSFDFDRLETKDFHYSKQTSHFYDEATKAAMAFGDEIHARLEQVDYLDLDQDLSFLPQSIQKSIQSLKQSSLIQTLKDPKFYQEYEFIDEVNGQSVTGIIDLLVIDQHQCIILDYKLKNIDDDAYEKQLQGYKQYLQKRFNGTIKGYLYSLMDQTLKQLF